VSGGGDGCHEEAPCVDSGHGGSKRRARLTVDGRLTDTIKYAVINAVK
jgi:hypothetical protein